MATSHRSRMVIEEFAFSQKIQNFSSQIRCGAYVSPMEYSEETDCNWTLVVELVRESEYPDSAQYCDYIEISLRRNDYKKKYQLIDVCLTIVDYFNIASYYASKEICFTPTFNKDIVLRVEENELFHGYCRLNKFRFVPNDILTVECEITAYDTVEENYENETELEGEAKYLNKENFERFLKLLCVVIPAVLFILVLSERSWTNALISKFIFMFDLLLIFVIFIPFEIWKIFLWFTEKLGGDKTYPKPKPQNRLYVDMDLD